MTTRIGSVDDAVAAIGSRDEVGVGLGPGIPGDLLHRLGGRDDFTDLVVSGALLTDLYELFLRPGVRYLSGFFGPAERFLRASGAVVEFVPADFRGFAPILEARAPRVMAVATTPPDADGHLSLSLHAGATVAELHRCGADPDRLLVAEMSSAFPRTTGLLPDHPHRLHLDEVDLAYETDRLPFVLEDPEPTAVDRAIAGHVAAFVHDGCTLQTGIGGVPSMVARMLADGDGGDYGIHSEMFTTGLMHLHRAGKVTNRKGTYDGRSITTFAAGTAELYEWLDGNEDVAFLPVDRVNSPEVIAANRDMVTLNGALTIDLAGQVVADSIGGRQFSGIGGHEDFVGGPGLDLTDRSLVCLPSTAVVDGTEVSRIVARLPAGSVVSTPRHHVDVVVTEHGAAELRGRTVAERAAALAGIADPRFRAELAAAAEELAAG